MDETEREQIRVLWQENEPRLKAERDASFSDQERPFDGFSLDLGPREADAQLAAIERLKSGTTCGVSFLGGADNALRARRYRILKA